MEQNMRRDVEFMRSPELWPVWPYLPVKRRNGKLSDADYCGLMVEDAWSGDKPIIRPTVYLALLGLGINRQTKMLHYDSIEKLAEEWQVD